MFQHRRAHRFTMVATICLIAVIAIASATATTTQIDAVNGTAVHANSTNYNCPEDCQCSLALNTHVPFLHAKCSSLDGLKSEAPLQASLPIHSIDLSYLQLSRLSHALEKLRDLTSIDLSHNELHEIGHLGRRIKKLNLKHNHITSGKLSKMPQHLTFLNLQNNDITYLPLEFTRLRNLRNLELSHNQINCSCETLEVRNWLQERQVFMENPVKCVYPTEVKGQSWLQVKQSDICDKEKNGYYADDDENELMMGDQPVEGSAENDEEEELGKDYLPIEKKTSAPKSNEVKFDDVEGSGDLSSMNLPMEVDEDAMEPAMLRAQSNEDMTTGMPDGDDELDDGSGSGGGILLFPKLAFAPLDNDDFGRSDGDDSDSHPVEQPHHAATASPDIFGAGMGIFDGPDGNKPKAAAADDDIWPVVYHEEAMGNVPDGEVITDSPPDGDVSGDILHAKVSEQEDSNATYFLLGVIALIVVGLILYVGIRRCKSNSNDRHDAENPRQTELLDMDKKNLGKPLPRNGNEHAPLIGEKSKSDMAKPINGSGKKPYDSSDSKDGPGQQQPLLNSNGSNAPKDGVPAEEEATKATAPNPNELSPHEYYPITPRYPTPKSPRASKYALYPQGEQNNNNTTNDAYLPSSPKSGRYSPVYSPETGRVKIKLTETPKPKTPMLVTRSKSNAGEIITTPVHATMQHMAVPVGGANGQVSQ